jgi:hypothetical protein
VPKYRRSDGIIVCAINITRYGGLGCSCLCHVSDFVELCHFVVVRLLCEAVVGVQCVVMVSVCAGTDISIQ